MQRLRDLSRVLAKIIYKIQKSKQNRKNKNPLEKSGLENRYFKRLSRVRTMKGEEVFDFHLGEKVYTLDTYHDESIDLIAVGLKNTILIYQISDEKENNETKPTLIQAVSYILFKCFKVFYRLKKISINTYFLASM